MANFFNENRIKCECRNELFEETKVYMLDKIYDSVIKIPYKSYYKCTLCGKLIEKE